MMRALAIAIAVACGLAATTANAQQTIYRCGNSYSQAPCPTAKLVDTDDSRSDAEVAEARQIAVREKQLASQLERDRLIAQATIQPALATGFNSRPKAPEAASRAVKKHKTKKRHHAASLRDDDEDFIAIAPDSLKRKKPAK